MEQNLKKDLPRATIHVLTYRNFDHIYKNIDSILSQTYGNIEIVIADDGSDSFPEDSIRNYLLERKRSNVANIVILAGKKNVGTVKNLNNAILHSTGVVYIPLSQDDEFFSADVVERIMKRYMDQPFNMLVTTCYGINERGEFVRFWPHIKAQHVIEKMSVKEMFCSYSEGLVGNMIPGSVMNISADFFRKIGPFDEKYKYWEDGPFIHKCLRLGYRIDTAYDIIAIKYEQTGGVSNSNSTILADDMNLFSESDFQIGINDYGFFHRRYMNYYNFRKKCNRSIVKYLIALLYFDVCIRKFLYSNIIRNWGGLDKKYSFNLL